MEQYQVTGMSCAACSARVEKAVSSVEGVTSCSVSLLTNSMGVEGTADSSVIIKAVEDAGYGAKKKGVQTQSNSSDADLLKDRETPVLKKRLITSLCFLIPLMYLSMGHMMWNWPIPKILDGNHVAMGLIQLLFTTIIMVINQKFFISGFKSLFHKAPNMDTLVALGSAASYGYSVYILFAMTDAQMHQNMDAVMKYMHEFYFESAAMILTLITVGKMLEARSKGKTTDALKSLMKLAPKTAVVIRNEQEIEVGIEQVHQGDIFVVKPGENIPVDGIIIEGNSALNESALTGESIPVDKKEGDTVSAATLNTSGYLKCEATRVGEDTTLSQIIQMVSDAAATKAPIAKVADKVSGIFVPTVICIAIATMIIWLLVGQSFGFALARGISVLVISCPCALGLATPVAIMVGNGMGAKHGIMFKTAVSLEETGKTQIIALDKTGTITSGKPQVTDMVPVEGISEEELLSIAYALEKKSEHPLAHAILQKAEEAQIHDNLEIKNFLAVAGNGLSGKIDKETVYGGNQRFIEKYAKIPLSMIKKSEELANQGKTPLFFACDEQLIGIIAVADVIKEDSPQAVKELQNMGMILTINSNGTLINEEWAEFFAKNKPRRINITLYGSKNETYENLCHMKDGFDKTIRGIELLKKYKIDVKINGSLVKKNFHDRMEIIDIGEKYDIPVRIDTYMYPSVRERTTPFNFQERLNPEDAAKARVEILHREMGDELFEQYAKQTIYLAEHTEEGDACPGHMTCRAGQSSFVVNWQGMIRSCIVLDQPSYDAFDTTDDFMTLWNKIVKETEEIKTSMECNQCKLRHVCNTCAAAAIAECGDSEGVSKYLCEYTKETVRNLKEFY